MLSEFAFSACVFAYVEIVRTEEPQRARERERERSIDSFACTIARLVHGIYIGGDKRRKKSEKKEAISISSR